MSSDALASLQQAPRRDPHLPPTRLPNDGPGCEIARHVLPWWMVTFFPRRVERAEQSPMFRALMRSAAKHRKSPGSLVGRRAWVRKGMYHEMIRDLREMGYSSRQIFADIELAATVPRWRVARAFRPWDPQDILMKLFFTLFLVLGVLWLLAEPSILPYPPHYPRVHPTDIILYRLNALGLDIIGVLSSDGGLALMSGMLLMAWVTWRFVYRETIKWNMLRGQLWMLRLPIMTREYAVAVFLTPLALVPIGGLILGWAGTDVAQAVFAPWGSWWRFIERIARTHTDMFNFGSYVLPVILASIGVVFANIMMWLMPFRLVLRMLVIRLLGLAMERERIADGD